MVNKPSENFLEQKQDEIKQIILKEFGKSEKDIEECLKVIKEWLISQKHLPETPNDNHLMQLLNFNKYSIEKVKQKLDMYYTVRTLIPDFYQDRHPCSPHMKRQSELTCYLPLPKLAPNYYRVVYCNFNEICTVEETNVEHYFALGFNTFEVLMQEDFCLGLIYVIDFGNLKVGHIPKFTVMLIKKVSFILEHVYSNRLAGIHIINTQPYLEVLINLMKTLLAQKLSKRIQVHKTVDDLFNIVPKEILPEDIGGDEIPLKKINDLWQEKFAAYKDHFDKLENLKVNEQLRPAPLVNDDILGYHGNFKKLSVD